MTSAKRLFEQLLYNWTSNLQLAYIRVALNFTTWKLSFLSGKTLKHFDFNLSCLPSRRTQETRLLSIRFAAPQHAQPIRETQNEHSGSEDLRYTKPSATDDTQASQDVRMLQLLDHLRGDRCPSLSRLCNQSVVPELRTGHRPRRINGAVARHSALERNQPILVRLEVIASKSLPLIFLSANLAAIQSTSHIRRSR